MNSIHKVDCSRRERKRVFWWISLIMDSTISYLFLFTFCSTGDQTQGLPQGRPTILHLATSSALYNLPILTFHQVGNDPVASECLHVTPIILKGVSPGGNNQKTILPWFNRDPPPFLYLRPVQRHLWFLEMTRQRPCTADIEWSNCY